MLARLVRSGIVLAALCAAGLAQAGAAEPADDEGRPAVAVEERVGKTFPVAVATDVRAAPQADAAVTGRLLQGARVLVTGIVTGRAWLQVLLPDGASVGYIATTAVPDLVGAGLRPLPAIVSGHPIVRDTATLMIGARPVHLFRLEGTDGRLADDLQRYISSAGGTVMCAQRDPGYYVCTLPDGTDLAMVALVNGAARALDGAPDGYLRQQQQARDALRGIWGSAAGPAP